MLRESINKTPLFFFYHLDLQQAEYSCKVLLSPCETVSVDFLPLKQLLHDFLHLCKQGMQGNYGRPSWIHCTLSEIQMFFSFIINILQGYNEYLYYLTLISKDMIIISFLQIRNLNPREIKRLDPGRQSLSAASVVYLDLMLLL